MLDGVNLGHIEGGLYVILTESRIVNWMQVRFFEFEFPGLTSSKSKNSEDTPRPAPLATPSSYSEDSDGHVEELDTFSESSDAA
ncbi:hypothetical protein FGB62_18g413 [Gracilaria domingensis]|nr:hypothetical protein FGB62_18g413 [Gracilaria domingensis]